MAEEKKLDNSPAIEALVREIQNLDENEFPAIRALADSELYRLRGGVADMLDIVEGKRVKLRSKINIPSDLYPHINFVGKLLGPGGQTLRGIQDLTKTKMAILGSGSLRDETKEKDLLSNGDPKYQHLKQKLHLQVDCLAPPTEAYYNISHALAEIRKVMLPESTGSVAPPWVASGQSSQSRGGRSSSGRGYTNQASYFAAINFNNPPPSTSVTALRGRGNGRSRSWVNCQAPTNGNVAAVVPNQNIGSQGADCYGNGVDQYGYQTQVTYEQTEYDTSGYEDYNSAYGQTDAWGKFGAGDSRGTARVHPYARPGVKEDTA